MHNRLSLVLAAFFSVTALAGCQASKYLHPQPVASASKWNLYCGESGDHKITANTSDALVAGALQALEPAAKHGGLYIYPELAKIHRVHGSPGEQFLAVMCAEYRDDPVLLKKKITLLTQITTVQKPAGPRPISVDQDWKEINSESYSQLVMLMRSVSAARELQLATMFSFVHGRSDQQSMKAISLCELAFMRKYLTRHHADSSKEFSLQNYDQELFKFTAETSSRECTESQRNTVVDFRGDGVLGPLFLEANAPMWESRAFAFGCADYIHAKPHLNFSDGECRDYYDHPYQRRVEAAQKVIETELFYPNNLEVAMIEPARWLFVTEGLGTAGDPAMLFITGVSEQSIRLQRLRTEYLNAIGDRTLGKADQTDKIKTLRTEIIDLLAIAFKGGLPGVTIIRDVARGAAETRDSPDFGFGNYLRIAPGAFNDQAWGRLAATLNRHTNFYTTDYFNTRAKFLLPAYSPWFASSHYLDRSLPFSFEDYARLKSTAGLANQRMGWMFIFHVKAKDRYDAKSLRAGQSPDFKTNWLDERTLTTDPMGERELAWVKFGHADPDEVNALLWLGEFEPAPELVKLVASKK